MEPLSNSSTVSHKWNVSSSESLDTLAIYQELSVSKEVPDSESKEYKTIGWDHHQIKEIGKERFYTSELGPCFVLCARGYDIHNKLTHIGMAHWFMKEEVPRNFCEQMRKTVGKGRIELFVGGGKNSTRGNKRYESIKRAASTHEIEIVHDVSRKYFRDIGVAVKGAPLMYRGSTGVAHAWFDQAYGPNLLINAIVAGKEIEELIKEGKEKGLNIILL